MITVIGWMIVGFFLGGAMVVATSAIMVAFRVPERFYYVALTLVPACCSLTITGLSLLF